MGKDVSKMFEKLARRIQFGGMNSGGSNGDEIKILLFFHKEIINVPGFKFLAFEIKISLRNHIVAGIGIRKGKNEGKSDT